MSSPKAILFTDWDGTVTLQDSNDTLTDDLGMGHAERMKLNDKIIDNSMSFRDAFKLMLDSVAANGHSLQYCIDYLREHIKLDPGFPETVQWCASNNIPLIVVSSGMNTVIETLIHNLLDPSLHPHIKVISNYVKSPNDKGSWNIVYKDDSSFGHDKHASIMEVVNQYYPDPTAKRGKLFYSGDGVSDISAARSCDLLFAKKGKDLVNICKNDGINYIEFDTFHDILAEMKKELDL